MPANRVEELERTVEEMQSTVGGLTDELVEAKERIRVLEAELDTDAPTRVPERREGREDGEDDVGGETAPTRTESVSTETPFDDEDEDEEAETEDSGTSDIIVA
ncbi:hypothetical protein [Saliphagus sp. LR7]|uniref:DUF7518 family protein n=1 Tax=Saliphagus sp. LR7 TaxID=2282654 RepID=UPI000DF73503|nr:hypothetical protein [Saliphagus sp. LR7]